MKPDAPDGIRSPHKWIDANLPGVITNDCRRWPRSPNKVTLVRGVHHTMKNHNSPATTPCPAARRTRRPAPARHEGDVPGVRLGGRSPHPNQRRCADLRRVPVHHARRLRTSGSTRQLPRQGPRPVPRHERSQLKEFALPELSLTKHRSEATNLAPTSATRRPAVAIARLPANAQGYRRLLRASAWNVELAEDAKRLRSHTGAR